MYAVIRTGGKQYCVEQGTVLDIERISGEVGGNIQFPEILLFADGEEVRVGQPLVQGASVDAEILAQDKGPKLTIFKKLRRQGKQLKKGHRQLKTRVKVTGLSAN